MNLFEKLLKKVKKNENELKQKIIVKKAESLLRQVNSLINSYLPGFEDKWLILKCSDDKELKEVIKIFSKLLPQEIKYSQSLEIIFLPYNEYYYARLVHLDFCLGKTDTKYVWRFDLFELLIGYLNKHDYLGLLEIDSIISKFNKFILLNIEEIHVLD
jgi:hypothetical protein